MRNREGSGHPKGHRGERSTCPWALSEHGGEVSRERANHVGQSGRRNSGCEGDRRGRQPVVDLGTVMVTAATSMDEQPSRSSNGLREGSMLWMTESRRGSRRECECVRFRLPMTLAGKRPRPLSGGPVLPKLIPSVPSVGAIGVVGRLAAAHRADRFSVWKPFQYS